MKHPTHTTILTLRKSATVNQQPAALSQDSAAALHMPAIDNQQCVIENAFLCFVQNKMDTTAKDILAKVCIDFYDKSVIAQSKSLLRDVVNPTYRVPNHRGDKQALEDFNDIYRMILEAGPNLKARFVVSDLSNLPPMKIENVDIVRLLKQLQQINEYVKVLTETQNEMATRMLQMNQLNDGASAQNVVNNYSVGEGQVRNTVHNVTSNPYNQAKYVDAPVHHSDGGANATVQHFVDNQTAGERVGQFTDSDDGASIGDQSMDSIDSVTSFETMSVDSEVDISDREMAKLFIPGRHRDKSSNAQHSSSHYRDALIQGTGSIADVKAAPPRWNQSAQQRHMNRNDDVIYGSGSGTGLRAATHKQNLPSAKPNGGESRITGIFVTRLEPKTSPQQVQHLVKRETGLLVRAEKLQSKYTTYASFYIRGDRRLQDTLLCAEMWPKGTLVKRFVEKV